MENLDNVALIIPAYNPDDKLPVLVDNLIRENAKYIIIVNDGSEPDSNYIFESLSDYKECVILKHAVNLGKGRSLKTAFNYFLNNDNNSIGVITVDADGQHTVPDMIKIADRLNESRNSLVLGVRNFSAEHIPFRSRFGNVLTKKVFSFASGIRVSDTQTGLRGIPNYFVKELMDVGGEKYEFEMNALLACNEHNIPIEEVEIQTIYIDENDSSHFNPIIDSMKIYFVFFKYILSSLASFGIDILLFSLLVGLLEDVLPSYYIIGATIGARILSSLFNYTFNRNIVFRSYKKYTLYKYYAVSICQMLVSAISVYMLYELIGTAEVGIKIFVDTLLFLLSFYIQREWVFKEGQN